MWSVLVRHVNLHLLNYAEVKEYLTVCDPNFSIYTLPPLKCDTLR